MISKKKILNFFGILTKGQNAIIEDEFIIFGDVVIEKILEVKKRARSIDDKANDFCPECGSRKVVDKIVCEGTINHCNHCGHQWYKSKLSSYSNNEVAMFVGEWFFKPMRTVLENDEALSIFEGLHRETITRFDEKTILFRRVYLPDYINNFKSIKEE